jgi:hypothetical protein
MNKRQLKKALTACRAALRSSGDTLDRAGAACAKATSRIMGLEEELKIAKEERHKFNVIVKLFDRGYFGVPIAYYSSTEVPINSDYIASEMRKHLRKYPIINVEVTVHLHGKEDCLNDCYIISAEEQCVEQVVSHIFERVGYEVSRKVVIW